MASPRGNTLIEKFGFKDDDLKKPKHDDIMFWLESEVKKHENTTDYFEFIGAYASLGKNIVSRSSRTTEKAAGEVRNILDENRTMSLESLTWEYEIKKGNWTVGFIDLLTQHKIYVPYPNDSFYITTVFEVKTEIPTMGELLRQIRAYEDSLYYQLRCSLDPCCNAKNLVLWRVVGPEISYKDSLRRQGVGSIVYPLDNVESCEGIY